MTPTRIGFRPAVPGDAAGINRVFNRFVVDSHISLDVESWTDRARSEWVDERNASGHIVLVAVRGEEVVGGAWSGPWRGKAGYARSAETTVMLDPSVRGAGVGERLYAALLSRLGELGFHRCYAVIALPNEASIRLHRKLGFNEIGTLDEVGYKDGRYISTMLMERRMNEEQRCR